MQQDQAPCYGDKAPGDRGEAPSVGTRHREWLSAGALGQALPIPLQPWTDEREGAKWVRSKEKGIISGSSGGTCLPSDTRTLPTAGPPSCCARATLARAGAALGHPWLCLAPAPALPWELPPWPGTPYLQSQRGMCLLPLVDSIGSTCPLSPPSPCLNPSMISRPFGSPGCAESQHKLQLARQLTASRQLTLGKGHSQRSCRG